MAWGIYVLQVREGSDAQPQDFWLVGPFSDDEVAEEWAEVNANDTWQMIEWDSDQPVRIVAPERALGWDELSSEQQQERVAALGKCPRCQQQANAFNHVSTPIGPADGVYGTCVECRIYWPLGTQWIAPADMDLDASREVTRIICDACELVDPPAAVLSLAREKGASLPRH